MKCPVCGSAMKKQYSFSGDLYQSNASRCVCTQCGYGGASGEDIFAEAVRKLQKEREETGDE